MVEDYNKTKKKKDPELDRNTIKVRLPDDIIYRLVKLQMQSAACRNKGFILDGYPRNLNNAKHIFLKPIEGYQPTSQTENSEVIDDSPYPGFEPDTSLLP